MQIAAKARVQLAIEMQPRTSRTASLVLETYLNCRDQGVAGLGLDSDDLLEIGVLDPGNITCLGGDSSCVALVDVLRVQKSI